MNYFHLLFIGVYLPLIIILYNLVPQKHRWKVLLIASYIFFWSISEILIIYLLITTLIMYFIGIWLDKIQRKRDEELKTSEKENKKNIRQACTKKQRKVLLLATIVMIGTLVILKYTPFITENLKSLFELLKLPIEISIIKFMIPIGISFYTLQALSYILDVYKERIKADKNLGRIALFISFFPQIMEGPICRYSETAEALWQGNKTTYKNLTFGLQRIALGFMKKKVIADRLNPIVDNVFLEYANYDGGIVAIRDDIIHVTAIYGFFWNNGCCNWYSRNFWSKNARKFQTTIFLKINIRILDKMAYNPWCMV